MKVKQPSRFEKLKFWKRKERFDAGSSGVGTMNDHSKVFYLMAPDN